jgi:hypothetical protein
MSATPWLYDRTGLIDRAVRTLEGKLVEESIGRRGGLPPVPAALPERVGGDPAFLPIAVLGSFSVMVTRRG